MSGWRGAGLNFVSAIMELECERFIRLRSRERERGGGGEYSRAAVKHSNGSGGGDEGEPSEEEEPRECVGGASELVLSQACTRLVICL